MSKNIITTRMIGDGLKHGFINIVSDGNDCYGVMCKIGGYNFYFAGLEGDTSTVTWYLINRTFDELVNEIYKALESFKENDMEDEYLYYYHYLKEELSKIHNL